MWTPNAPLGFIPAGWPVMMNPRIPWTRPRRDDDPRVNPQTGGGRRLRHPHFDDIVYPECPNRTMGFDWDVLRKTRAVVTRTEKASVTAHYPENNDDVIIQEIWDAGSASVSIDFYRLLRQYREEVLPDGDHIGWSPLDLSPYSYAIEILDVRLGSGDSERAQEHGDYEPFLLAEPLTLVFKLLQELKPPTGTLVLMGH